MCHCFGVFGEAVASRSVRERALHDRRRSCSGTLIQKIDKALDPTFPSRYGDLSQNFFNSKTKHLFNQRRLNEIRQRENGRVRVPQTK